MLPRTYPLVTGMTQDNEEGGVTVSRRRDASRWFHLTCQIFEYPQWRDRRISSPMPLAGNAMTPGEGMTQNNGKFVLTSDAEKSRVLAEIMQLERPNIGGSLTFFEQAGSSEDG